MNTPATPYLAPGATLGVLGGGQLGRMFVHAAQQMGYFTAVLDPDADSPAGRVSHHHVQAGYADVVRPYTPGPGVYTYWDYTQLRFPRREGMRIDFVLGSPEFARRVTAAEIDRQERKGKGASDHAPVIVELAD